MEHNLCLLLYSNYSSFSDKILRMTKFNYKTDCFKKMGLKYVCIDNKQIRNKIMSSNVINISYIPCILILYHDGVVEKYDDDKVFKWVDDMIYKHSDNEPATHENEDTIKMELENKLRQELEYKEKMMVMSYKEKMMELEHKEKMMKLEFDSSRTEHTNMTSNIDNIGNEEGADDDDDDDDDEQINSRVTHSKPLVGVRNGAGNYDMTSEFGAEEEQNRDMSRNTKPDTTSTSNSKSDIMSTAMAMQKERENGESVKRNKLN